MFFNPSHLGSVSCFEKLCNFSIILGSQSVSSGCDLLIGSNKLMHSNFICLVAAVTQGHKISFLRFPVNNHVERITARKNAPYFKFVKCCSLTTFKNCTFALNIRMHTTLAKLKTAMEMAFWPYINMTLRDKNMEEK